MKYILVLALFVLGSQAIPIKNNQKEVDQLLKDKAAIVNDRLADFQSAAEVGDTNTLKTLLEKLVEAQKRAHDNLVKAFPAIKMMTNALKGLSSQGDLHPIIERVKGGLKDVALHALAALVDGNRDNVSYYMYDAAQEWIEKRVGGKFASAGLQKNLNDAREAILNVRDSLDSTAQVFVNTIKGIRATNDKAQIQELVKKLVDAVGTSDLTNKSTTATNMVNAVASNPQ